MAIKQRKQLTGTTAQINAYAGVEGQLVFDKATKHLHVLSGTAGTSTKLANVSDIPTPVDISGKADKTYVDTELAKKQAKGDYATNTALTQGLAGKAPTNHTHTSAQVTDLNATISNALKPYATTDTVNTELDKKANKSHTHTVSQITDFPEIPDTSTLIPKSGNRGSIGGYETGGTSSGSTTIDVTSPDSMYITNLEAAGTITVRCSTENVCATKVLRIVGDSTGQIVGGASTTLTWAGGKAPTMKNNMLVIVHYSGKGNEAVVNAIALE